MKYPEKVERQPDRIAAVRYPEKVRCRSDRIAAVRHSDKVERWPDPNVRYPGGMSENFCPDGMSAEKNSECDIPKWNERCHMSQGRGSHAAIFREDPTVSTPYRAQNISHASLNRD